MMAIEDEVDIGELNQIYRRQSDAQKPGDGNTNPAIFEVSFQGLEVGIKVLNTPGAPLDLFNGYGPNAGIRSRANLDAILLL